MAHHTIDSPIRVDGSEGKPHRLQVHSGQVSYTTAKGVKRQLRSGDPAVTLTHSTRVVPVDTASIYLLS